MACKYVCFSHFVSCACHSSTPKTDEEKCKCLLTQGLSTVCNDLTCERNHCHFAPKTEEWPQEKELLYDFWLEYKKGTTAEERDNTIHSFTEKLHSLILKAKEVVEMNAYDRGFWMGTEHERERILAALPKYKPRPNSIDISWNKCIDAIRDAIEQEKKEE